MRQLGRGGFLQRQGRKRMWRPELVFSQARHSADCGGLRSLATPCPEVYATLALTLENSSRHFPLNAYIDLHTWTLSLLRTSHAGLGHQNSDRQRPSVIMFDRNGAVASHSMKSIYSKDPSIIDFEPLCSIFSKTKAEVERAIQPCGLRRPAGQGQAIAERRSIH